MRRKHAKTKFAVAAVVALSMLLLAMISTTISGCSIIGSVTGQTGFEEEYKAATFAGCGDLELIKELVEDDKAVLNEKLPYDNRFVGDDVSPLYFVQRENRQPLFAKYMLDSGADPNQAYGKTTLLMCANGAGDSIGDSYFVKMLLEHGADTNLEDDAGYTALDYATENLLVDNMKALVEKGAKITINAMGIVSNAETIDENNYFAAKIIFDAAEKQGVDYDTYKMFGLAVLGKADELVAECKAQGGEYEAKLPFYAAAYCGKGAMEYFRDNGVGLDQQDEAGNSLLYVAASTGNLEVVQYLVENGVSLGFAEYQPLDYDPLKVAIINNNYDTAKYLLDSGASFNIDEALGYDGSIGDLYVGELFKANDSLQGAAQNGNMEMIHLIEDHGFPMNENTYYRALKAATINGQLEVMEYFFRKGADPNYVDSRFADNASLLEICASNGNLEAVQLLKKYGATIETDDSDALANAVSAGNYDIAEYLIANRMNINSYSKTHNNPKLFSAWHAASEHGYFDLIKLLLKNGADVNDKYTAMLVCYAKGSTRITKYLIDNGADVNLQQSDGTAALHIAAQNHRTENVRMLLAAGADPGIKNDEGKTALDIAKEAGADEIEGLLNSK